LYVISMALTTLWLLGLDTPYVANGLVHLLLMFAIVLVLVRVLSARHVFKRRHHHTPWRHP